MPLNPRLLNTYLDALPTFSVSTQIHFCERMFRITGEPQYADKLGTLIHGQIEDKLSFFDQLNTFDPSTVDSNEKVRATMRRNPLEKKRVERREQYYQQNPKLKFYFELVSTMQLYLDWQLDSGAYQLPITNLVKQMKQHDWSWFFKPEHLAIHPVLFTNCVFFLRNMQVIDQTEHLSNLVHHLFPTTRLLDDELLYDQLYIYTHIIIGETRFYQQFLTSGHTSKYGWIYDFFHQNFAQLLGNTNLDLVLEILLCFDLARLERPPAIDQAAVGYLDHHFDVSKTYLVADNQATLEDMEHANILLLMIQHKPERLYGTNQVLF